MMYSILVEVAAIARGRKITTETVGPSRDPVPQQGTPETESGEAKPGRNGVAYAPIAMAGVLLGGIIWLAI